MTEEVERLRMQAEKCRWLAAPLTPRDCDTLLDLAAEYERRAEELERMLLCEG